MVEFAKIDAAERSRFGGRALLGINRALVVKGPSILNLTVSEAYSRAADRLNTALLSITCLPIPQLKLSEKIKAPSYYFMAYAAAAISTAVMHFSAKREGIDPKSAVKAYATGVGSGALGAFLMYQAETIGKPGRETLMDVIWPTASHATETPFFGFSWFGGVFAGVAAMLIYAKAKDIPLKKFLDAMVPAGLTFHAIARIGCLLSGDDCYGIPTNLPWGVELHPGNPVHPAPLYLSVADMINTAIVWRMGRSKKFDGQTFLVGLGLHSLSRFVIEFWRTNPEVLGPFSLYQLISMGLCTLTAVLLGIGIRRANQGGNTNG